MFNNRKIDNKKRLESQKQNETRASQNEELFTTKP